MFRTALTALAAATLATSFAPHTRVNTKVNSQSTSVMNDNPEANLKDMDNRRACNILSASFGTDLEVHSP